MPVLSIVTTVYDRVQCLNNAIQSVRALNFKDYEHIIVSDNPDSDIVQSITQLVDSFSDNKISYVNLDKRHNNWGIAPAEKGLKMSTGKYLAFLSDDNGYLPNHFDSMIPALEADSALSFVYSACWYRDLGLFAYPYPEDCKIDLGQPVFRRSVFSTALGDTLPFNVYGWDWRLIHCFMQHGSWKFFSEPTFVFRLTDYPEYLPKVNEVSCVG